MFDLKPIFSPLFSMFRYVEVLHLGNKGKIKYHGMVIFMALQMLCVITVSLKFMVS